ncbi:MAG TPA: choice-of-anchor R domain-containing protein [Candidatus Paceibacterota bacterium]|nr:choice-of-anchor R domain-containing protein [Candidatus Paceibacterota bacterium]
MRPSLHRPASHGYVLVLTLVFLGIFFTVATAYLSFVTTSARNALTSVASAQALSLAEAGMDEAAYQLNQNPSYSGESNTPLGGGVFTVTISSVNSNTKLITATGYVPNSTSPVATKIVRTEVGINSNIVSFRYGIQTGAGGFVLSGGATINGSVYSNGNINATTGVHITGSAVAADPPAVSADQVNDSPSISSCTSSTCITFANTTATQDVAQSFKISTAVPLNNIQFYLKKVGAPSDAVVRIVTDNGGSPGTNLLMSSTLSAATVTANFGWVTVTMPSTPVLSPSQTYWIVIDASSNSSKYYILGANTGGYVNGTAKIGKYGGTWSATTPAGLDGYFKLYLGGGTSMIGGNTYATGVYIGTTASDSAWAHTVMGATVTGPLYCQSGSYTNKACDTSQPDPTPQPLPLSDNNIQDWKNEAAAGGVITGDYTVGYAGATLGPKEITGNLLVDGGGTLTVSGTLWVQGTITVSGGGKVVLASSYGTNDGAIVSDGYVAVNGGGTFSGSGQAGSYPFLITTSACPVAPGCDGNDAVTMSGGAGTVAIVAQNGTANIEGGSALKAVTANEIDMSGGASLVYDSGLINSNFSSGPGGSWNFVPGSYAITQ